MTARPGHFGADRQAFIDRTLTDARRFGGPVEARPGGMVRAGRPYLALACYCAADACPGFAMVHDQPEAIAYFQRLFGEPPPRPASAAALDANAVRREVAA